MVKNATLFCRFLTFQLSFHQKISFIPVEKNKQYKMLVRHIVKQGLLMRNAGVMSRAAYHAPGDHQAPTMNDLPIPQGDWHEQHSRQNSKYNAVLATGIAVLAGTIGLAVSMKLIHLNYSAPQSLD